MEQTKGAIRPQRRIKKQVVAGFVIYRRTSEGIKFLLLYRRGNYWNFPKGHFDRGENSIATALRETEEETGIKKSELRIISGFRTYEQFYFHRGDQKIHDTVILYLAETHKADIKIAAREHSGFAWFLYKDAIRVLGDKYSATQEVLKQAHDFIYRRHSRHRLNKQNLRITTKKHFQEKIRF
ncbi:NUDIX domain-containing protein [Candidatus Wolfebacteria bacterium]|nr:NUDIX domain-containing protein [Candidatus Wolfebacteria bacterium]